MKRLILTPLAAVAVMSAASFAILTPEKEVSTLTLDNILALADGEEQNFAERNETTVSIWDDTNKIYKSVTVIECNGKGEIACP